MQHSQHPRNPWWWSTDYRSPLTSVGWCWLHNVHLIRFTLTSQEKMLKMLGSLPEFFFHFLWCWMLKDGSILTGSEDKHIIAHKVISLHKGYYFLAGKCVALALVYGGTGPHFFSESITSYIFNEELNIVAINEIPDDLLRVKITKASFFWIVHIIVKLMLGLINWMAVRQLVWCCFNKS